jgi:WD40 repeat protein
VITLFHKNHSDALGVDSVSYSPNGQEIAALSLSDKAAKIWDIRASYNNIMTFSNSCVYCLAYLNDNVLITGGTNRRILFWDLRNEKLMKTVSINGLLSCLHVPNQSFNLFSGDIENSIRRWKINISDDTLDIKLSWRTDRTFYNNSFFKSAKNISLESRAILLKHGIDNTTGHLENLKKDNSFRINVSYDDQKESFYYEKM